MRLIAFSWIEEIAPLKEHIMKSRNGSRLQTRSGRLLIELLAALTAIGLSAFCAATIIFSLERQSDFRSKNRRLGASFSVNRSATESKRTGAPRCAPSRVPAAGLTPPGVASSPSPSQEAAAGSIQLQDRAVTHP
jgi:hypothetical protein